MVESLLKVTEGERESLSRIRACLGGGEARYEFGDRSCGCWSVTPLRPDAGMVCDRVMLMGTGTLRPPPLACMPLRSSSDCEGISSASDGTSFPSVRSVRAALGGEPRAASSSRTGSRERSVMDDGRCGDEASDDTHE